MTAEWIIVGLTLVIAFFTFLVLKIYDRIAWLTGAMETHSGLLLRIEAMRGITENHPIDLIWWDPTIGKPPIIQEHGQKVEMRKVYVFLPPELRKNRASWKTRIKNLFTDWRQF